MRLLLPLALASLTVAGCSGGGGGNNTAAANASGGGATSDAKLAALVAGDGELERVNRMIGNAGMGDLLAGVGPYTLFAPTNSALEGLGEGRADGLASEGMGPQAAALLRAHIVPGTLTRRDLAAAIENAGGKPVRMRTMADTMLTFTKEGDAIAVASDDGARARVTGQEGIGANGALQPIDGVLRRMR